MPELTLATIPTADNQSMLEVLDTMREAIQAGKVKAFIAVGIEPDDCTMYWCGAHEGVTRLRMLGALNRMNVAYATGEI